VLLTRAPLVLILLLSSFDLHVLGTPPAFVLSQNQTLQFYTKAAPRTSARIMQLIQAKFYDGLLINRAIPNFIIQTGDPTGTGKGGSGTVIKSEFNELQHIKGTIGMARGTDKDSADSQFYISLTTLPHLDGKNTVFGQVVDGLDILPKLSKGDRIMTITLNLNDNSAN
jgi:cyclophilin family peptidyl-prolyl cis-trans isomerase